MRDLGLENQLLMTSKNSPAAQNRFIYYPDHLVRMPGPGSTLLKNLLNLWSEPVFDGVISGLLTEVTKTARPDHVHDESIGSFLSRRCGTPLADNIASAVFHGIYAGDIYKLSARSILSGLWQQEKRHDSIVKGTLLSASGGLLPIATNDLETIRDLQKQPEKSGPLEAAQKASVFTFEGGIEELSDRLEAKLSESPEVKIARNTIATDLKLKTDSVTPKVRTNPISSRRHYFSASIDFEF